MSSGGGEWVPLYITFFLGIVLFTVVPTTVSTFCDIDNFLENPNFSPADCPINDYALQVTPVANFITHGITIDLWGLLGSGIRINLFSVFGLFPNNVVQLFLSKSLASFAFLPEHTAITSLALFFLGLIYSVARLVRG